MPPEAPKKIAVLGGGVSSLTTVLSLTSEPDWQTKYDITVYQLGWRLGGKGASGRNGVVVRRDGKGAIDGSARIQEHGLHIWLGFYENAFRLIQQVYLENEANLPPDAPLRLWTDAFKKHSFICLEEEYGEQRWRSWSVNFPEDDLVPGSGGPPSTVWDYIKLLLDHLVDYWKDSTYASDVLGPSEQAPIHGVLHRFEASLGKIWADASALGIASATEVLQIAHSFAQKLHPDPDQHGAEDHAALSATLGTFRDSLYKRYEQRREFPAHSVDEVESSDWARRDFIVMDLGIAILRGLIADGIIFRPDEFDSLEEEFQSWLSRHGASDESCRVKQSSVIRGLYDLVFAYIDGDTEQASFATGPALRSVFDMLLRYKGAIFWKMQAGMGDTIFSPIYMVLKQRGVKFEFFHKVDNIGLSEDKRSIATVRMGRQVHLNAPTQEYDPLVWVKGVPCWPADPDYSQIVEGEQLQAQSINLESFWTPWKDVGTLTLQAGVHFDQVVLGISLGSLPFLCPELIEAAPDTWGNMVAKVKTVRTMGFQFWVNQNLKELGWEEESPVMDAYAEPLNTWADMSQLLVRENWGDAEKQPQCCAYFCGQLIEEVPPEEATQHVREVAAKFVAGPLRNLWPKLQCARPNEFLTRQRRVAHGREVPFEELPPPGAVGNRQADEADDDEALASQFYRANVDPSERYVMSVANATGARLRADQAGFEGLVLTGDWISNGFNAGCVESAVMSGLQAANVVAGRPLAYGITSLRASFGQ